MYEAATGRPAKRGLALGEVTLSQLCDRLHTSATGLHSGEKVCVTLDLPRVNVLYLLAEVTRLRTIEAKLQELLGHS